MSSDGNSDYEVKARLAKARTAFRALRNFLRSGNISQNTKLRMFKTNILSTLFYGSKSYNITETVLNKLEKIRKCLRSILRIVYRNVIIVL